MIENIYDVAILGTGLSGTIVAAILARHGHRVIMIDRSSHPRFAIGESVLPKGSLWFRLLASRYGVPELENFGSSKLICQHVAATTGRKIVNGFLYHHSGLRQHPDEAHVFIPTQTPLGWDSHLFRQDTDHYLLHVAVNYGAEYLPDTTIRDIDIASDGVFMRCEDSEEIRCRYVVDATGGHSLLASTLGLREEPTRLRTHSRSIFTHMQNVRDFNDLLSESEKPPTRYTWRDGTVQHIFDSGWFWLIPFGNHEYSGNALCSVGIVLDTTKHPESDLPPEREFQQFAAQFPSIAEQLAHAEAVRPWIKTGRLQYSSSTSVGERFFLTSNAYGFVDPLHSRGILCSNEILFHFADDLLRALHDDDFSADRFDHVDVLQRRTLDFADRHISNFYTCFSSYPLWNAWLRLHVMNEFVGYMALVRRYAVYLQSGNRAAFGVLDGQPMPSSIYPNFAGLERLYVQAEEYLERYRCGLDGAAEAASKIIELLRASEYLPPMFDWTRPEYNHVDSTPEKARNVARWGRSEAPLELRQHVFDFARETLEQVKV
ncbi:MAG: tryptophan 7-halogenase [Proteobacteria bacterium]|nr:tryptophan 7-halogenase [Pseudomonadota bacterium]